MMDINSFAPSFNPQERSFALNPDWVKTQNTPPTQQPQSFALNPAWVEEQNMTHVEPIGYTNDNIPLDNEALVQAQQDLAARLLKNTKSLDVPSPSLWNRATKITMYGLKQTATTVTYVLCMPFFLAKATADTLITVGRYHSM